MPPIAVVWLPHAAQRVNNPNTWEACQKHLSSPILTLDDLFNALLLFSKYCSNGATDAFERLRGIKGMVSPEMEALVVEGFHNASKLVLRAPELFKEAIQEGYPAGCIPLLPSGEDARVVLSREQAACVVACQLFCLISNETRCVITQEGECKRFGGAWPGCDFVDFFSALGPYSSSQLGRFLCVMNYFTRVGKEIPKGFLTVHRRRVMRSQVPKWKNSTMSITKITALEKGKIEEAEGGLQGDFANAFIGGGALQTGNVQEEIRFVLSPALLISMVLCERMDDDESIVIHGSEQFSTPEGYGGRFKFGGNYVDGAPRTREGAPITTVVGFDALPIGFGDDQFSSRLIRRELHKCWAAIGWTEEPQRPFVTGHWGCGMFGGNKELKALIQILACSQAGRDVEYMCFGDARIAQLLEGLNSVRKEWTVGALYDFVVQYGKTKEHESKGALESLLE